MTLSPNYFVTSDVDTFFIDKDTGLPLANGTLTFYRDSARNEPKPVFELSGSPPDYTYISMGAQITLSAVGTVQDSGGNNEVIYYLPFDDEGNLDLYYVVCESENGVQQWVREGWPNKVVDIPPPPPVGSVVQQGNFLIGWDFVFNPSQLGASGTLAPQSGITASNAYITDQTIGVYATNPVTWANVENGISFTTTAATDAFYIMQYLSGESVQRMLGTYMSTNVFGFQVGSGSPVTMQIYLFSSINSSVPPLSGGTTTGTITPTGAFTSTAGGWVPIPRSGSDIPVATLRQVINPNDINNGNNDYGFSQWQITDSIQLNNANLFAIVVTFAYIGVTSITIPSISLVPGNVPSRPYVQSPDEVLRQCQYYYENSYSQYGVRSQSGCGIINPSNTQSPAGQKGISATSFIVNFKTIKRTAPKVTFFSPYTGAANFVGALTNNPGTVNFSADFAISNWAAEPSPVSYNLKMFANTSNSVYGGSTVANSEYITIYHYSADSRLGVV